MEKTKKTVREILELEKTMTSVLIYSRNRAVDMKFQWEVDNELILSDELLNKKVDYISASKDMLMICVFLEDEENE